MRASCARRTAAARRPVAGGRLAALDDGADLFGHRLGLGLVEPMTVPGSPHASQRRERGGGSRRRKPLRCAVVIGARQQAHTYLKQHLGDRTLIHGLHASPPSIETGPHAGGCVRAGLCGPQ